MTHALYPIETSLTPNLFIEATENPQLSGQALQTVALDLETPFPMLSPGVLNNLIASREAGEGVATAESMGPAGGGIAWNEFLRAYGDAALANFQRAAALSAGGVPT